MYKVVIGLEVHCELETKSKNFSPAPNMFTEAHNINVATVDLGLPGILPVANKEAVRRSLFTAMALNCENPDEVLFDRKNYYYADLPKGYQITQVTKPMGRDGYLDIRVGDAIKRVYIHQLHLEEDTASLDHMNNYSLIDYNRSGIPLMEIVTEPCMSSADEAVTFLEDLRDLFLFCEVSEARSNKGQMRCDVNISLMEEGSNVLGTKVEMKNINAFDQVRAAIEYEIKRQTEVLESGEKVVQETRRIADDEKTYPMRKKVDAIDYKYYIEPNLAPVKLTDEYLEEIRKTVPVLKLDREEMYMEKYNLSLYDASVLAKNRKIADYFEEVLEYGSDVLLTVNFVTTAVLSSLKKLEISIDQFFITPKMLSGVIDLVYAKKISLDNAKKILYQAIEKKKDPLEIINESNISQISDDSKLLEFIKEAIDENPDQVRQYVEEGKDYLVNYFIGKVMQKSNRQANPNRSLELIKIELEKRKN